MFLTNHYPPLRLGAAVLGSHALHAVGEQHHQPALPHPLRLAGADELQRDNIVRVQNNEKYLRVTKFSAIFTSLLETPTSKAGRIFVNQTTCQF